MTSLFFPSSSPSSIVYSDASFETETKSNITSSRVTSNLKQLPLTCSADIGRALQRTRLARRGQQEMVVICLHARDEGALL